ncbi:hypothetical protein [Actinomadura parmotrematis]|uniref:Uncharacterized protein n=1 Tax=Actinomadura parmotrematis TaxID=2864039 RepID=A0ABS7FR52_9ACTN|nr:hypothetical protein [Actinomadura parmotrematis]MBW8482882.1 hypothetical protein [Actinomadura parmotrematis]
MDGATGPYDSTEQRDIAARVQEHYGLKIWWGAWTGRYWAFVPWGAWGCLVEGRTPEELLARVAERRAELQARRRG